MEPKFQANGLGDEQTVIQLEMFRNWLLKIAAVQTSPLVETKQKNESSTTYKVMNIFVSFHLILPRPRV